jgi:hypothetical protein
MIELTDSERATQAAQWCRRQRIPYELEYWGWPGNTRYRFIFSNSKHLTLFSLKWA